MIIPSELRAGWSNWVRRRIISPATFHRKFTTPHASCPRHETRVGPLYRNELFRYRGNFARGGFHYFAGADAGRADTNAPHRSVDGSANDLEIGQKQAARNRGNVQTDTTTLLPNTTTPDDVAVVRVFPTDFTSS